MKKLVVFVAAALMLSTPAFAAIDGTSHDLASEYASSGEICVFCHTPHAADTNAANAPLWNRNVTAGTTVNSFYDSTTLSATAAAVTDIAGTDAPLCLSCHDSAAVVSLVNPPNGLAAPASLGVVGSGGMTEIVGDGSGLANDHPVGFDYAAARAQDSELKDIAGNTNVALYGGAVWCSSCHDVHGKAGIPTFLLSSNVDSALCLQCHDK